MDLMSGGHGDVSRHGTTDDGTGDKVRIHTGNEPAGI
jgi:hypothetical protein